MIVKGVVIVVLECLKVVSKCCLLIVIESFEVDGKLIFLIFDIDFISLLVGVLWVFFNYVGFSFIMFVWFNY